MPTLVFGPKVPHNPQNYMIPSRISAWWQSICPNGSLDVPIELGSIGDIEFTPNETVLDLKSTRTGIMSIDSRVVTDVSGELSLKLHEIVGSNVNLLFRPATVTKNTLSNPVTVYGSQRVRLVGTAATPVGTDGVEYDVAGNAVSYASLTVLRVESGLIADIEGRGTPYSGSTDYLFTQATTATQYLLRVKTATSVVPDVAATFTVDDQFVNYSGLTGTPQLGETLNVQGGGTATLVAYVPATATTGKVVVRGLAGGTIDNGDTLTGATSTAVFTCSGSAAITEPALTIVRYPSVASGVLDVVVTPTTSTVTPAEFDSAVAQAASVTALGGLAVSSGGLNDGRVSIWDPINAAAPATLARRAGSTIPDGAEVVCAYSYTRLATSYSILDGIIIEGRLQIQILSVNGPQAMYVLNRVNLSIDGSIAINPEQRHEATMKAVILPDGTGQRGTFVLFDGFAKLALTDCT